MSTKNLTWTEAVTKLEKLITQTVESIDMSNNSIWNEKQGVMLKSLTGALLDMHELESMKKNPVKKGN